MDKISIQKQDFDLSREMLIAKADNATIGAVVSFVGLVRDFAEGGLEKMTLEHYPGMTEKALQTIINKARLRWDIAHITIIHRVGTLKVSEQIVLLIVASAHREVAFSACQFIIDFLKTEATFWKKEHTKNASQWVEAKSSDRQGQKKWKN